MKIRGDVVYEDEQEYVRQREQCHGNKPKQSKSNSSVSSKKA